MSAGSADELPETHVTQEEEAAWIRRLGEEGRCHEILRPLYRLPVHGATQYAVQEAQLTQLCTTFAESFEHETCRMMSVAT